MNVASPLLNRPSVTLINCSTAIFFNKNPAVEEVPKNKYLHYELQTEYAPLVYLDWTVLFLHTSIYIVTIGAASLKTTLK